jgi:hypothetical protein
MKFLEKRLHLFVGGLLVAAPPTIAPAAVASEAPSVWTCQVVGTDEIEPVGDQKDHNLQVYSYSCQIAGGPLDGGVATGSTISEWKGLKSNRVAEMGVVRKPGSVAVYSEGSESVTLAMADGKITGCSATGTGRYVFATGDWARLAGKTDSFKGRCAPVGFVVEQTFN